MNVPAGGKVDDGRRAGLRRAVENTDKPILAHLQGMWAFRRECLRHSNADAPMGEAALKHLATSGCRYFKLKQKIALHIFK